ncbi:MAG: Glycosyltransferase subfamily 4-like N-terminal domain-containing protein [uncultured Clostridium sp.]
MMNLDNKKKVRVLEISHGLAPGGIESFLINVFENIDKDKIEINFALACEGKQFYEDKVISEGAKVYHTSDLNGIKNIITHFFKLIKLLKKEGPFDVVHTNIDFFNGINLLAAFVVGVPVRISHSHNTNSAHARTVGATLPIRIYRKVMRIIINALATKKVGCSKAANLYMYGSKVKNTIVINNGVDFDKFISSSEIKSLNIDSNEIKFVTVGRMCEQKNSIFIIKVINELTKINKRIHLYWIGKGPQEEEVKKLIKEYKLERNITLLGSRRDVPNILTKMDFMLFPSKWEGLPVTLVEAQVANLPCFISDKITDEADLGLCTVIPLEKGEKQWAELINNYIKNSNFKKEIIEGRINSFNIKNVVKDIERMYLQA